MTTKTLFRWEQDPNGGDHGTLVLWPDTHRQLRMIVQDFKTAASWYAKAAAQGDTDAPAARDACLAHAAAAAAAAAASHR
jgi:hypothetical protein